MITSVANIVIVFLLCVALALGEIRSSDHVVKTIKTEEGDVFNCIDINRQPALDHPLLKNHEIQMKPSSYPYELHNRSLSEATKLIAQFPFVACPEGSVPILQDRKDGKIDISNFHPMASYVGKGELAGIRTIDDIYGSYVSINVYEPKVKEKTEDFSASWVEMSNNENTSYYETIAVGSVVWPSLHGDNFARFHASWYGKGNNACWDHRCPGFVQVSSSVGLGGRVKPISVKTIKTEEGDVFNCIDINRQPALDHPLLKNHEIQMKPSSYPYELHNRSLSEATKLIAQLPFVACPEGSVPILQDRKDGKIDISNFHPMASYVGKGELAGIRTIDDIYGSYVSINVYEPKVKEKIEDFSASWVEMSNNENTSYYETIAIGSVVWPSLHGDNFARFHASWYGKGNNACWDHRCPGFVQVSPSVGLGGRVKPISVYNGLQYDIHVLLVKDPKTTNWWLAHGKNKTPIGYWPSSLFHNLKDKSNIAFWGGHLSGPTIQSNFPEMGSGHFASEGFGKAAFMRDIKILDGNNMYATPNIVKTIASSSRMTCYIVDKFGQDNDGMHVYYVGPGGCTN